ncbi:MAG: DUF484 family protein [Burkholderiaceae bacterium]
MTEPSIPPITEDDIAEYLANTPDFFERHAGVLATVQLTSPHGNRAVSLQERQAEMLREKIKGLELRLMEMMRHGQENSGIAERLQDWTQALLLARDPASLPEVVTTEIASHFHVPQVAVRLWDLAAAYVEAPFTQGVSDDVKAFASSLTRPYCGANPGLEAAQWLEDAKAANSLALIPLRAEGETAAFGLLVLASTTPYLSAADMGTSFRTHRHLQAQRFARDQTPAEPAQA